MVERAIKPLPQGPEWTVSDLQLYMDIVEKVATEEFNLETYPFQWEIITAENMLDAYSNIGLPLQYNHWKFGKYYNHYSNLYKKGKTNLAYELICNTSPCIAYLMDTNNLVTQALVISHCWGHNSFFKNNFLFKEWTNADSIVDYCLFARDYISDCEKRYGYENVEKILDSAHALEHHGVDKYKRPPSLSLKKEIEMQQQRIEDNQKYIYEFYNTLPININKNMENKIEEETFPKEPQENILYFLEKHSPILKPWQREILRIVRKISQYFYPQSQTRLSNEGLKIVPQIFEYLMKIS